MSERDVQAPLFLELLSAVRAEREAQGVYEERAAESREAEATVLKGRIRLASQEEAVRAVELRLVDEGLTDELRDELTRLIRAEATVQELNQVDEDLATEARDARRAAKKLLTKAKDRVLEIRREILTGATGLPLMDSARPDPDDAEAAAREEARRLSEERIGVVRRPAGEPEAAAPRTGPYPRPSRADEQPVRRSKAKRAEAAASSATA